MASKLTQKQQEVINLLIAHSGYVMEQQYTDKTIYQVVRPSNVADISYEVITYIHWRTFRALLSKSLLEYQPQLQHDTNHYSIGIYSLNLAV